MSVGDSVARSGGAFLGGEPLLNLRCGAALIGGLLFVVDVSASACMISTAIVTMLVWVRTADVNPGILRAAGPRPCRRVRRRCHPRPTITA
jgi:hypothetical protein